MEVTSERSFKGLSTSGLKIIACISMLIDHATYVFIPENDINGWMGVSVPYLVGRCIGRSAFVIFAFLLVEGFFKTSDRRKYMLRMLVFALISEPAFDYMCERVSLSDFFIRQNILFSFVLSLLFMSLLEMVKERFGYLPDIYSQIKYNICAACLCVAGFLAAYLLRVDYGAVGIGLVFIFYFLRGKAKWKIGLTVFIWSLVCIALEYMLEWAGLIALVPIFMYSGEQGKGSKWVFYVFFPVHMMILGLLKFCFL